MRVAVDLDMHYSMSNRQLEALDVAMGEGHKKTEKEISDVETMKLFDWMSVKVQFG